MRKWAVSEVNWLIENYPKLGQIACAKHLARSPQSIRQKTWRLGLEQDRKSEFFKDWQTRAANSKIGKKRPAQAEVIRSLHRSGKLVKTEQQKINTSIAMKEQWKRLPHPRGMAGKKHSADTLKILSALVIKRWGDPNYVGNQEAYRQHLSDRMAKLQREKGLRQGYSRGKQGKRSDLNDLYVRSSWEANYARYLNFLLKNKQIYRWEYEPDTFWFEEIKRGTRSYTPDFKIWERADTKPYYIEVKGWMDQKSKVRLSRMEKYYPDIKIQLVTKKEYYAIKRSISKLIPGWE